MAEETNARIKRMAKPGHHGLLNALLVLDEFTYEDLGELADKTAATLRVRFKQWRDKGIDLLEEAGSAESSLRGADPKLWRLHEKGRLLVSEALELVEAGQELVVPEVTWVPSMDDAIELLKRAEDEKDDLSWRRLRAGQVQTFLMEIEVVLRVRTRSFVIDNRIFGKLESRMDQAKGLVERLNKLIHDKHKDVKQSAKKVSLGLPDTKVVADYFSNIPERSVSGYGGALLLRAQPQHEKILDCAFLHELRHNHSNFELSKGFGHAVGEVLRLASIEPDWMETARDIKRAATECTPIAELPSVSDALSAGKELDELDADLNEDLKVDADTFAPWGSTPYLALDPGFRRMVEKIDAATAAQLD